MKRGDHIEISVGHLIIEAKRVHPRTGWADDAKRIAEIGDDQLVLGEFGNEGDAELTW